MNGNERDLLISFIINDMAGDDKEAGVYESNYYKVIDFTKYYM